MCTYFTTNKFMYILCTLTRIGGMLKTCYFCTVYIGPKFEIEIAHWVKIFLEGAQSLHLSFTV